MDDKKKLFEEGRCPGADEIKRPRPEYFKCPSCGSEVEIWTDEIKGTCQRCGETVSRKAAQSCIEWCKHAERCIGTEKYRRLMAEKEED